MSKIIDRLKSLVFFKKSYEDSVREFGQILEEEEILSKSLETLSSVYYQTLRGIDSQLDGSDFSSEFLKSQRESLISKYLGQLGQKKETFDELICKKNSFLKKYPLIEKSLQEIRKEDFIIKSLQNYREGLISLEDYNLILKSLNKTSSKVEYCDNIVLNTEGKLLIVQRGPLDKNGPNVWVLPGGHRDGDESYEDGAKRELLEETGYVVDGVTKVGEYEDEKCHIEYYHSIVNEKTQSPTLDADETRYSQFVDIKDLYKYPTMYNIWDNVYKILGIEIDVVKIKKSLSEGVLKSEKLEEVVNLKIDEILKRRIEPTMKELRERENCSEEETVVVEKKEEVEKSVLSGSSIDVSLDEVTDQELLRLAITAELDATTLYEKMAEKTTNEKIKKVLLDVAKEEKTHVGEFESLLKEFDQEQAKESEEGEKEVEEKTKSLIDDEEIEKSQRASIGEVRTWKDGKKRQKQSNGEWVEVDSTNQSKKSDLVEKIVLSDLDKNAQYRLSELSPYPPSTILKQSIDRKIWGKIVSQELSKKSNNDRVLLRTLVNKYNKLLESSENK